MKNILAIDVGTQSSRAGIVSADGKVVGIAQIPHDVDSPHPGWAQQRPDAWWDEICRAIGQVLSQTGVGADSIAAVSSCGQMHGPVGIDDDGRVTTEWVQLWCDKRSKEQCEELRRRQDESRLAAIAANLATPAWVGLKVRWYKDHQPESYRLARWFLVPKDFINYRLTGVAATDPSEASGTFLWDCRADCYSPSLADAVGVDLRRFAPVYPSHGVIGPVTEAAAKLTGLRPGTPVVAGGGDFPVSMLGFGIVGQGIASDVSGTSTLFALHHARPLIHPSVYNLRHVVPGWIPFSLLDCGGLSVAWARDLIRSARDANVSFDDLIRMAETVPEGSDGLVFYPYMLGERRPENTSARGAYFGITLNHTAAHFARAAIEGVALGMGRDVEVFKHLGVAVDRIFCVGGGARNQLLIQIKADVTGVPMELADEPEAGLKGAALLGAAGAGLIADPGLVAVERRIATASLQPRPESVGRYREVLDEYMRIYDHMLGFWQEMLV